MSHDKHEHMKSKSDLNMDPTRFEDIGRRGTAPTPFVEDHARMPNNTSMNYMKPEFSAEDQKLGT